MLGRLEKKKEGSSKVTNNASLENYGDKELYYDSGLLHSQKTIKIGHGMNETKKKKKKNALNAIFNLFGTCVSSFRGDEYEIVEAKHNTHANKKWFQWTDDEEKESNNDTAESVLNESEYFDCLEEEDDEDVTERTKKLHAAMRQLGLVPSHSIGTPWVNAKLVRSNYELFIEDYFGDFYARLSPNVPDLEPKGACLRLNADRMDDVLQYETEAFRGRCCLRIKNAAGAPHTDYFNGRKRLFSLQVQGRFKKDPPSTINDFFSGAQLENQVDLPFWAPKVIDFVQSRDPSLVIELQKDPPNAGGPLATAALRFSETPLIDGEVPEWSWGGDLVLLEMNTNDEKESSQLSDLRRKNFSRWQEKTQWRGWDKSKAIAFDNFQCYLDFTTMKIHLGTVLSFPIGAVMGWQKITLVGYNKQNPSEVYYAIEMGWNKKR